MYTRNTELRRLHERDEYNLALKLTERDCWRLMEVIPLRINAQQCSNQGTLDWQQAINKDGRKYRHEHFELMKNAFRASGGTRLVSQILLDEWKTSGRKEERPTLGVLLQLLIGAGCWMAADFLATDLLNEPKPERPLDGPAARFDFPISEICNDVEDYVNDSNNYPNTEDLAYSVNGFNSMNNNRDYRTKFMFDKQVLMPRTIDNNSTASAIDMQVHNLTTAELLNGGKTITTTTTSSIIAHAASRAITTTLPINNTEVTNTQHSAIPATTITQTLNVEHASTSSNSRNIPLISSLMTRDKTLPITSTLTQSNYISDESSCAKPPAAAAAAAVYSFLSEAPIPNLSIFDINPTNAAEVDSVYNVNASNPSNPNLAASTNARITNEILPGLSELYIDCAQNINNGDAQVDCVSSGSNSNSSISNIDNLDVDDLDLFENQSVPNLSIFEQNSYNDSSLTNITGTSGENSFEMSSIQDDAELPTNITAKDTSHEKTSMETEPNDSELHSQDNIPCLSALQQ